MFARMQAVKASAPVDEFGDSLNNVEKVLRRFDIQLRDGIDSFRPLGDVLDEIASKWEDFSSVEKSQIAESIAGVRQRENLLVLLNNYNQVLRAQGIEATSAGLANERYAIYMQGVEAALNRSKAAWEGVWQATIESGAIKWFYDLSAGIGNNITQVGGLIPVVGLLIGAFIALQAVGVVAFIKDIYSAVLGAINGLKILIGTLEATSLAAGTTAATITGGIGLIIVAIGAIVMAYNALHKTAKETLDEINAKIDEHKSKLESLKSSATQLSSISDEYEKLRVNQNRTNGEEERFLELNNEIHKLLPQISGNYDELGNFILTTGINQKILNDEIQRQIELEAIQKQQDIVAGIDAEITTLEELIAARKKAQASVDNVNAREIVVNLQDDMREIVKTIGDFALIARKGEGFGQITQAQFAHDLSDANLVLSESNSKAALGIAEMRAKYFELLPAERELYELKLAESGLAPEIIRAIIDESVALDHGKQATDDAVDAAARLAAQQEALKATAEDVALSMDDLISGFQMAQSAMEEQTRTGQISFQTAEKLIAAGYAEAVVYNQLTGTFQFNAVGARNAALAQANLAIATALAKYEAQAAIDPYSKLTLALWGVYQAAVAAGAALAAQASFVLPDIAAITGGGGGGSSGGGGKSAEQIRLEAEIAALEKKKKALQDALDEYNKYIAAQKEALKRAKELADFNDKQLKKETDLAKLQARIAILALDNSEEANAERIKLEEEAANLSVEIAQDQEDRKYDLQIQALDDLQAAFEEKIQAQIDAIDELIAKYQEQISAMTSGSSSYTSAVTKDNATVQISYEQMMATIYAMFTEKYGLLDRAHYDWISNELARMMKLGMSYQEIIDALQAMLLLQQQTGQTSSSTGNGSDFILDTSWYGNGGNGLPHLHSGGLVNDAIENHHAGEFAGGLKSNEVFAKLLKGEYVATEGQMSNFMTNILPTIANSPPTGSSNVTGDTNVSMPITVTGNLDESVIPDLQKMMDNTVGLINESMRGRGYQRPVESYAI